ncbi:carbon-nitrogen hydrolase family protein [bacterium]|nr:carbon-nitrogen hydrolase family protein [bacterium]
MKVKVATVSMALEFRKANSIDDNLKYIEAVLEEMEGIKPDIVALPEVFPYVGVPIKAGDIKDSERAKEFLSEMAKKHRVYLTGSIYDNRNGKIFNTCLLYDKKGELVGKYDKIHPTEPEMEEGVIPGAEEQEPVDTEFGKIGFQICFDANWSHYWRQLVEKGAKMIIFSSAYPAGRVLNSIALLNNVYIVASTWELKSGIIDNMGRWLVKTNRFSFWVWENIEIDKGVFHWDFQEEKTREIRRKYGDKVKIETFADEALFTIEPLTDELDIEEIIQEFKLVRYKDYLQRAERRQNEKRFELKC